MLQSISHKLIVAILFFLPGVTYDRTHTIILYKMNNISQVMPKVFALFTIGAMASLALPEMSSFASEIYSLIFCTAAVFLSAVGLI